ncbi:MAG: hypothetical protein RX318_03850 [bacterium]|nr:hypothetical protein [bacterium]
MGEKQPVAAKPARPVRRVVKIELNRNALAAVVIVGIYATLVLALWLGQTETVKVLIGLLEKMIEAVKPNIDAIVMGGGIAGAAGYGIRQAVKNSGGGK